MILILLLILLVCLFINVTKIRKKTYKTLKLSMKPNITRRTNSFNEGFTGFNKNEIVNTFNKTGCPNKNPDTSWWGTQSKKTVLNDMYDYCNLTNDGTGNANQIKHCCGKNNPNCGKDKLTCKKQSDILPPYCAKSKTYGGAPGTDSCAGIKSATICNFQSWCEWRGESPSPPSPPPTGELEINNIREDKPEWWSNLPKEEIFKEKNGSDYRGFQNKTVTGKKCQKWTSRSPHKHVYNPDKYPNRGLGDHNYCRNPDNANDIWCYTTDSKKRWEWCDPKKKNSQEIFKEDNGSDYRGFQNKTLSGKKCKKWPSNFISKHSEDYDKGLSNNNYCRNPDSSDSIWCFTDNNTREFCSPLTNKIKEGTSQGKKEGLIEGTIDDNIMTQIQKDFIHKTKLLPDKVLKDYIHKTRVKPYSCPKCPEMSDYVLKSSVSCH